MSDTSNKIAGLTLSDQLGEELRQAENPFALVVVCFVSMQSRVESKHQLETIPCISEEITARKSIPGSPN